MGRPLIHPSPKPAVVRTGRPPAAAPSLPTRSRGARRFPVIGLGDSAVGLEALEEFLRHVPASRGLTFEDYQVSPDRATHGSPPVHLRELLDQK